MMPLLCACCTAWQTGRNSSSRSRAVSWCWSQYSVIGMPLTSSMTKYGRPAPVVPASSTWAMFGWSISARACRSASNRAITSRLSMPGLDDLERHLAADGLLLLGDEDQAHTPLADLLHQLVRADDGTGTLIQPGRRSGDDGRFEEPPQPDLGLEEGLDFGPRFRVGACRGQECLTFAGVGNRQRVREDVAFVHGVSVPTGRHHSSAREGQCVSEMGSPPEISERFRRPSFTPGRDFPPKERPGVSPGALGSALREAESVRCFRHGHADKVAEFYQPRRLRVARG